MQARPTASDEPPRRSIRLKLAFVIGAVVIALMSIDTVWSMQMQQEQQLNEAREKAAALADEMLAVWRFIDINQDTVNRNPDGTFRSKALVCVVAAKSIGALFTQSTDYTVRYASETPRQSSGIPDDFEQKAIDAFNADEGREAYWSVDYAEDGQKVFRYVIPLRVTETCLECHGEPAGEPDQYGWPKEGMTVGSLGGVMSIIEPMDIYEQAAASQTFQHVAMVFILLLTVSGVAYVTSNALIMRPIESLGRAARRVGSGDFSYELDVRPLGGTDEMCEFSRDFDRMAQQLKLLCNDLEGEVQHQTEALVASNELLLKQQTELEEALSRLSDEKEFKDDFFAIVSHELRTPLTSILAHVRMLAAQDGLDEKGHASIAEIETNGTILLNLVNNILSISKIEAHRDALMPEPVDFVDLLALVKNSLAPVAANRGVALSAKADADVPVCLADWEKLRRIVENLVDNAIKYTHPGGRVNVRVRFEPPASSVGDGDGEAAGLGEDTHPTGQTDGGDGARGTIVIDVADDGIGIAEEDQPHIFERYRQGRQSPNRRFKGTGLGLAVVKELAEMHNGSVSVHSTRKEGSTFTVRIPCIALETEDDDEDSAC